MSKARLIITAVVVEGRTKSEVARDGRTPWQTYTARPKATATGPYIDPHWRVRHDKVDKAGTVTVRHHSRLHHIGVGRCLAGTRVTLLVDDLHIRIIDRHTGELLRELTIDPDATTSPPDDHPAQSRNRTGPDLHSVGPGHSDVPGHHRVGLTVCWFRTSRTGVSRHAGLMSPEIPD